MAGNDQDRAAAKPMTEDQVSRYRQAAEEVLEQLDWCVGYLHRIRKNAIAGQLARNRSSIRQTLMRRPRRMAPAPDRRYRQAAEDGLQQLDWCIGYLHGIRRARIAAQLATNRARIRSTLMRKAHEPLPSEVTTEA